MTATAFAAPIGVRLAHKLPGEVLKKVFAVYLLLIAARMLWNNFF